MCCSDLWCAVGGVADLRSALHLHRVTSLWEALVTEPGTVRAEVQTPAGEVPLLEKGHLRAQTPRETHCIKVKHQHSDVHRQKTLNY